jgi:hypothetical protein
MWDIYICLNLIKLVHNISNVVPGLPIILFTVNMQKCSITNSLRRPSTSELRANLSGADAQYPSHVRGTFDCVRILFHGDHELTLADAPNIQLALNQAKS